MSRSMRDIYEQGRPREKLLRKGVAALSDQELMAVLLGKCTAVMDVMALARKVVRTIDEKGLNVKAADLSNFQGVGDIKATAVLAAIEFARRRVKPKGAKIEITSDLIPHVHHLVDRRQEHLICASINGANEI